MNELLSILPKEIIVDGDGQTREVYVDGKSLSPAVSQKLRNHSPDGFNWGYEGSGPAQLALAILLRFMPADEAQRYYQAFKRAVVARWPQGEDFEATVKLREMIEGFQKE